VQVAGEVAHRRQVLGVILANHSAAAGQDVLIQLAGRLMLTQVGQIEEF
jgi:hypothetical protein